MPFIPISLDFFARAGQTCRPPGRVTALLRNRPRRTKPGRAKAPDKETKQMKNKWLFAAVMAAVALFMYASVFWVMSK